jgi:hypothetical protein
VATQQGEGSTPPKQHPSPEALHYFNSARGQLLGLGDHCAEVARHLEAAQTEARNFRHANIDEGSAGWHARADLRKAEVWCADLAQRLHEAAGTLHAQGVVAHTLAKKAQEGGAQ